MSPADVAVVAELVRARSGLHLSTDRGYLVESRLGPVARQAGFSTVAELVATLRMRRDEGLSLAVADAMANAETWFFRNRSAFRLLAEELLPALAAARPGGEVRVWSAGCSTGQEPYSLALAVAAAPPQRTALRLEIMATDISRRLLEKAHAGVYSQFEVQRGLPIRQLIGAFSREDDQWRLADRVRRSVRFRLVNLLEDTRKLGRFDVILCRHVLSAMAEEARVEVLARLWGQLADDGLLLLGETETLGGVTDVFRPVAGRRGLYVKAASRRVAA